MASAIELLLLASAAPLLKEGASGLWSLDWSQADLTTHTLGNTVSNTALTATWSITAGDPAAGTVYIVETPATGVWKVQTLNLGVFINGTYTNVAPVSSAAFTTGVNFGGIIRARFTVLTTGSSGTVQVDLEAPLNDETNPRSPSNSLTALGHVTSVTVNTTTAFTLAAGASWGGTATGQSLSGITSTITRKGP